MKNNLPTASMPTALTASDAPKLQTERVALQGGQVPPSLPPEGTVVETDLGPAGRLNGHWFKWWPEMKSFGRVAMKTVPSWWVNGAGDTQAGDKR